MSAPSLGPFALSERIGMGGMGQVWHAVHVEQQLEVAVKVLTTSHARLPRYQEAFRREVRAVASLNHPGIITVLDYGQIPERSADPLPDAFAPGSPYLVMELADGGSLFMGNHVQSWSELRTVLFHVLDALAHSHARGLVHRDLKPGNVLLVRGRCKLSDFGIARPLLATSNRGEWAEAGQSSGTPAYMPPEQIQGRWRDYGPWTDLYALGCMAQMLACGRAPFWGDNRAVIARAHLTDEPEPLEPLFPVPRALADWILRLLAKRPADRFQRAADAAAALGHLPGLESRDVIPAVTRSRRGDLVSVRQGTIDLDRQTFAATEAGATLSFQVFDDDGDDASGGTAGRVRSEAPPLPSSWMPPTGRERRAQLAGTGLGLFGLRPVPFVDRDPQRNLLWQVLEEVIRSRRAQGVVVSGASGRGKSRLVEWIAQRGHEVGAVDVLKVTHTPQLGPTDGLAPAVSARLGCVGLDRDRTWKRISAHLEGWELPQSDAAALTELLRPGGGPADSVVPQVQFSSPTERHAVLHRLLAQLALGRPVLLWIDDVQWAPDAIAFVHYLLAQQTELPTPVMVVFTAQEEALSVRLEERRALRALVEAHDLSTTELGPLRPQDHEELVRLSLGLEPKLVRRVAERTGGNPLFAVQLVGDWVERGLLVQGPEGFVLGSDAEVQLPDDIHHLWRLRIDRVVERYGETAEQARRALELAAALGLAVDNAELAAACTQAGLALPLDLVDTLISRRLAHAEPTGWSFAHVMLRESLERSATEAHRWQDWHRTCAEMLQHHPGRDPRRAAERSARHLLRAGDAETALGPLLMAAQRHVAATDFPRAHALLDLRDQAMDELDLSEADARRCRGWLVRGDIHRLQWSFGPATEWCARVLSTAQDQPELAGVAAEARLSIALTLWYLGDLPRALRLAEQARSDFSRLQEEKGLARALLATGRILEDLGRHDQANALLEQAFQAFKSRDDHAGQAECLLARGGVMRQVGSYDKGLDRYGLAGAMYERMGDRLHMAHSLNGMGDCARLTGELERSERYYARAARLYRDIGSPDRVLPELGLALVALQRGRFVAAARGFEDALSRIERTGQRSFLLYPNLGLYACAAGRDDPTRGIIHRLAVEKLIEETGVVDVDLATVAEQAASLWERGGQLEEAHEARRLSAAQWRALGNEERAAALEEAPPPS